VAVRIGWTAAVAEHEREVANLIAALQRVDRAGWTHAPAPGKWSPAAVAVHICQAYQLGAAAAAGGTGMRLRVSPPVAWLSRTVLLPAMLATQRFPRGVPAPSEVRPDLAVAERLVPEAAVACIVRSADEAAAALRRAGREQPNLRITHAYFGPLTPRATLRLLSAHTRHHARALGGNAAL
jgi:hypothetical protein